MARSILFVHQGYELYGSDRTLIQSIQAVWSRWPEARITVLLPSDGLLRAALPEFVSDVRVVNLAILRRSNLKRTNLLDAGVVIRKAIQAYRMMQGYDITYINTVTVLDYILASCLTRRPSVIHVHEIPGGIARAVFSTLVAMSRAFVIFNSLATRRKFVIPFWRRSSVVWNGVASWPARAVKGRNPKLNLLVIGRFNSWKGQGIVLRAVAQLPEASRARVALRLVGSVFESQDHFSEELVKMIRDLEVSETVEMLPFTAEPYAHYAWADVVIVPSLKPEPFGLVAIEAMAAGCSVIAANHGGLPEIVVDGVTGSLVVPGSVESMSAAMMHYIEDPARAASEGIAGRERFDREFEESRYKLKIAHIVAELCEPGPG